MYPYRTSYYVTHPHKFLQNTWYSVKWFCQRGWRGYADIDSWSVNGYLNSWMPITIRGLKTEYGYPVDVYVELYPHEDWTKMDPTHSVIAHARWHEILELMAQGFEAAEKISAFDFEGATELTQLTIQMNEGLRLFSKYYQNLWS